jgi:nitroreductase
LQPVPRGPYTKSEVELWAAKSTALACENLVLAFRAHGFDTCMMEGFDAVRVSKLLHLKTVHFRLWLLVQVNAQMMVYFGHKYVLTEIYLCMRFKLNCLYLLAK